MTFRMMNDGSIELKTTSCRRLLVFAIILTAPFTSQRMNARNAPYTAQSREATQQSATRSADQASGDQSSTGQASDEKQASNEKKEQQTFTGVIEKSGDQRHREIWRPAGAHRPAHQDQLSAR